MYPLQKWTLFTSISIPLWLPHQKQQWRKKITKQTKNGEILYKYILYILYSYKEKKQEIWNNNNKK